MRFKAARDITARSWVFIVLSAVLQILPFPIAGPVPLWRRLFCWVCLAPMLLALLDIGKSNKPLTPRQTFLLGYLCGVVWYLGNCYWIYPTMHLYGGIPEVASVGILFLFSLYLGLYHALFGWIVGLLRAHFGRQIVLLIGPLLWVSVELARARITGFPWDLLGYTQVDNHLLTQVAPWTGVFGLSLLVAAVNVLWLTKRKGATKQDYFYPVLAIVFVIVITAVGSRNSKDAIATTSKATLLQENLSVGKEQNERPESKDEMLASFSALSVGTQTKPQIIIWPEAPADFFDADPQFRSALGALASRTKAPIISDSITVASRNERAVQLYNSASFFDTNGEHVGRYDKMHLVPFGEYTPYKQLFFFAGHLLDNVGPFIPGTARQLFVTGGHRYGVFICYESIFGDEVRQFAQLGADVLVNISDDGWYGDSSAPWEHLDMARMRAIENNRWVLRSTNTGVTGAIDPQGRVVAELPRHIRAALSVPFNYERETTFYTRHGDWIAWLCAVVTGGALLLGLRRRRAVN